MTRLLLLLIALASVTMTAQTVLTFSTYLGGSSEDSLRDLTTDAQGNIYLVGGTSSANFPRTIGPVYHAGACATLGSGGRMDAFVAKLSPTGQLLWSQFLGGHCYDRAYAVELDSVGNVFVAGRAGQGFPTTTVGSLQPVFGGDVTPRGLYGAQDGFIAKLSPTGAVVWATYVGGNDGGIIRDIDLDTADNLYIVQQHITRNVPYITSGAFRTTRPGGEDVAIFKLTATGQLVWGSYYGGSGYEGEGASVRVDTANQPHIFLVTDSSNLPLKNPHQKTRAGGRDFAVAKFAATGGSLIYSTYLGGAAREGVETHHIALDWQGNLLAHGYTLSTNFPVTPNAFQPTNRGGWDATVSKFSPTGQLLASTYLGGAGTESPQGMEVDWAGNPVIFGGTTSSNFPVTPNVYQATRRGAEDVFVAKLSADLRQNLYATYVGGTLIDQARAGALDAVGRLIAGGWTTSTNYPVANASKGTYAGGAHDVIVTSLTVP